MKNLLGFLVLAAIAIGVIWYEQQPQTVTIPIKTDDVEFDYSTTTQPPTTTLVRRAARVDFSHPDVTFEVHGKNGDDVNLREVVGKPRSLESLPAEAEATLRSCPGVTDRDMVVRVDTEIKLDSSLPVEVDVDYHALGQPAVFEFGDGTTCSPGNTHYKLEPGKLGHLTYWVALTGVITPDHPQGDFQNVSWALGGLTLRLPNLEGADWKLYGPRVVRCTTILGETTKIWLAGTMPQIDDDCQVANP